MWTMATDHSVARCVCLSVCYVAALWKTAERIEVLCAVETLGDRKHIVLDHSTARENWEGILLIVKSTKIAHIRCGLCQITLVVCFLLSIF